MELAANSSLYWFVDSNGGAATYQFSVEAQNPASRCQTALAVLAGDTAGDFADGSFAFEGHCGGKGSVLVFRYTPAVTGPTRVQAIPGDANMDLALYARSSCGNTATEIACADEGWAGETDELPILDLRNGEPIYLFVQNAGGRTGTFTLSITAY
jgi:hypothetical protein